MLFQVARLIELLRVDDTGRGTHVLTSKFKFKTQVLNWARTDVAPIGKGYFQAVSYILLIYGPDANWKSFESAELRGNNILGPGCQSNEFHRDADNVIVNPTQKPAWFGALFAMHHGTQGYWVWDLTTGGSGAVPILCVCL